MEKNKLKIKKLQKESDKCIEQLEAMQVKASNYRKEMDELTKEATKLNNRVQSICDELEKLI